MAEFWLEEKERADSLKAMSMYIVKWVFKEHNKILLIIILKRFLERESDLFKSNIFLKKNVLIQK